MMDDELILMKDMDMEDMDMKDINNMKTCSNGLVHIEKKEEAKCKKKEEWISCSFSAA